MMKVTVAMEVGNRVVAEQLVFENTRQAFRDAIGEMACRMELATFGPPGPVQDMTAEDRPIGFKQPDA
jgi:hypothetical protein